jgi:autotransporter-associated beta strand protein
LEEFEPKITPDVSGTWTAATNAPPTPVGQLLLLTDGRVLALGSDNQQWYLLAPDSAGNYYDGTWTTAAAMSTDREFFVSNVLPDGNVLALGGENLADANTFIGSGEIYGSVANKWTPIDYFPGPQLNPATEPNIGPDPVPSELIRDANGNDRILVGATWSPQTYLLDWTAAQGSQWVGPEGPGTNFEPIYKLTADGSGPATDGRGDISLEEGSVLLPDGSVLTYDLDRSHPPVGSDVATFKAERYFPSMGPFGQWGDASNVDGSNPQPLGFYGVDSESANEIGPPMLLPPDQDHPDGLVLWMGANNFTALYDPAGITTNAAGVTEYGTWSRGPDQPPGLTGEEESVAELPNGRILLTVGTINGVSGSYVWEYDPDSNSFIQASTNNGPAGGGGLIDLPNGHVLLAVGAGGVWDFDPNVAQTDINDAWRPQIHDQVTHDPSDPMTTFTLQGSQLTGMSEGSTEGDDEEMSTNYPIVKLSLGDNVWYAKTHDWTPGVQDTSITSVKFDLPANLSPGATYTLTVVANGIPSSPISFTPDSAAVYADSSWANLPNGTVVDADPVLAGTQSRIIGIDAFATVDAAIGAAPAGGWVIVNGANGPSGSGVFHEPVATSNSVGLFLQNGSVTFDSLTGPSASIIDLGGSDLTTGGSTPSEYDGSLGGVGGLIKVGTGAFELTGTNDIVGIGGNAATAVDQGTLEIESDAQLGAAGALVTLDGGTIQAGTDFSTVKPFTLGLNGGTIDTQGFNVTMSGRILVASGSLTKIGAGTLTLAGTDLANGLTTVSAGTLVVTGTIGGSGGVTVDTGATLRGSGGRINGSVVVAGTLGGGAATSTGDLFQVGSLSITSTGVLATPLNGPSPGSGYDEVLGQMGRSYSRARTSSGSRPAAGAAPMPGRYSKSGLMARATANSGRFRAVMVAAHLGR